MTKTHKGHTILVIASRLAITRHWKVCLTVIWSEEGRGIVNKLTLHRKFRLREEAEKDGWLFARKWIDDGKRHLSFDLEYSSL